MKNFLFICLGILIGILIFGALGILYLSLNEYKPEDVTVLKTEVNSDMTSPSTLTLTSWNIGYCGLGENEDFILDGGKSSYPVKENFIKYFNGVLDSLSEMDSDILLLQEVDTNSKRSYSTDEYLATEHVFPEYDSCFAMNYKAIFVPFPLLNPIGKVESGIATFSKYAIDSAERFSLPGEYSWPTRVVHLKRCMSVSEIPVENSDKSLIAVNIHLSAYDNGDLRTAQLDFLKKFIVDKYEEGYYVVVGGDWNNILPVPGADEYELKEGEKYWKPMDIPEDWTPEGWTWGADGSIPTYRSLDEPLVTAEKGQYGVIDGFLISPNIELINAEGIDLGFENSDHNPVKIEIVLK